MKAKRQTALEFLLGVALLCGAAAAAEDAVPEAMCSVTFIEVRSDGVDRAKQLLGEEARTLHKAAPAVRTELLQELARPERFLIVEESTGAEAPPAHSLTSLDAVLTAPPDRRANRAFVSTATAPAGGAGALYVAAHVDIGPPSLARGEALLQKLAHAARASAGNVSFDVWRQTDRPNHFNLIAVWRTRGDFDAFTASAAALDFRSSVAPLLGSLYDDRLYRLLGE
jgi:quinol monooxygenase YgiN